MDRFLLGVGNLAFAICAIPSAIKAIQTGADDSSIAFLLLWLLGETCLLTWAARQELWIMLLNYIPNIACIMIMLGYNLS